jgi:catechol 2,3-dioxygenase-like lactoylglutathione lyase family enzyme
LTTAGTNAAEHRDGRDASAPRPRLQNIRAVTYAVPDLDAVERAYTGVLGYEVRERGRLAPALASAWAAPAMAGRETLALVPASGEACELRFVRSPAAAGWRALVTHGWNATEFVVQRVDDLAARLADSPFVVIGPPTSLTRFPMIRAMQAVGPFGECCYFTQVGAGSGLDLAIAESYVGRVFIAVAGGADVDAMFDPYVAFANDFDPPVATPVRVLSAANGLPLETPHRHGLVKVGSGTLVELDAYPDMTRPRAVPPGELPPGMAIVTLLVDRLPGALEAAAYDSGLGGRAALLRGRAGELIELVTA